MNIETIKRSTISEIANQHPGAIQVFENLHVDYCCNGKTPFSEACKQAHMSEEEMIVALVYPPPSSTHSSIRAQDWSLDLLTTYIVQNHHQYVKRAIPEIKGLLLRVCNKHSANHPELQEIEKQFLVLAKELESHMYNEEQILFPAINALVKQSSSILPMGDSGAGKTISNLSPIILTMEDDHTLAGHCLLRIREVSQHFTLPADACNAFALLYRRLREFEEDLHTHIHLENNLLFPKTLTLQSRQQEKPIYVN